MLARKYLLIGLMATGLAWLVFQAPPAKAATSCVNYSGGIGSICTLSAQANDPEGDRVYYEFQWGDTTSTRVPQTDGTLAPGTSCGGADTSGGTVPSGTICSADHTWTSAGQFTIYVVARDEAGHESAASNPTVVNIDGTPPGVSFNPTNQTWNSNSISVAVGLTDTNGVSYGRYCWTNSTSCDPGTTTSNISPFTCSGSSPCNATITQNNTGSWYLCVRARDTASNWNPNPVCSGPYQYDAAAPTTPGQPTATPNPNNTGSFTLSWTASTDAGGSGVAGYYIYQSLNGGAYSPASPSSTATNSWQPSPSLAAGTYTYIVYAYDNVGLTSSGSTASTNVVVDKTAPQNPTCTPGSGTYGGSQAVSCSSSDQGSPTTSVSIRYTSGATTPADPTCASSAWVNPTTVSSNTVIKVIACDAATNQSSVVTYTYNISSSGPTLNYTPNGSSGWQSTATTITLTATDASGIAAAKYNWDNPASSTVGTNFTNNQTITSPTGSHTLYLWAQNGLGNQSTLGPSNAYQYDNQAPFTAASSPSSVQVAPFVVSVSVTDYPLAPTANSGVNTWDLQYKAGSGGSWTNCKTGIPAAQTSLVFGTDCVPAVTLVTETTYYFQARAVDNAGNISVYPGGDGQSSTLYRINNPPNTPNSPSPADSSLAALQTTLSWYGGDPDVADGLTYKVYISQPNQPLNINNDLDGTLTVLPNQQNPVLYGTPQARVLQAGAVYQWQVSSDDTPTGQTTYGGRPVWGPVWTFTVNSAPTVDSGTVMPTGGGSAVDDQGTATWQVTDPNNSQVLTFDIYLNTTPQSLTGATLIANDISSTTCSKVGNTWTCSYVWSTKCILAGNNWYLVIKVSDGLDTSVGGGTTSFVINHTKTIYYPGSSSYATANNGANVLLAIGEGSLGTDNGPTITYKGVCTSPTTQNPQVQVGTSAASSYNGSLSNGQVSPAIPLTGLVPGSNNQMLFTVGGCGQTGYQIRYDLVTSCGEPYLSVQQGSIYSGGDIRSQYMPPQGGFNATYLILNGGDLAQPRVIQNFISTSSDYLKPNYGPLTYPNTSNTNQIKVGQFDYYKLVHTADGSAVADGGTDAYGYTVRVFDSSVNPRLSSASLGTDFNLNGQIYYFKGSLTIDAPILFRNATAQGSGAGLIIVDGDLTISGGDLSYEAAPLSGTTIKNLASVGWLVRGNITIAPAVTQLVGTFYASGDQSGAGIFDTGSSSVQLRVYGMLIAKQFKLNRTYSVAGEPSEYVIADGRILINTPPGFGDLLSTLPTWRLRTP